MAPARSRVESLRDPLIAGVVALVVSLIGVGIPSINFDGAATVSAATRPLGDLWRMLGNVDAVHGLYYLVMHPVFAVFGYSPVSLRAPSAIFVGVAAAFVVVLARQLRIGPSPLIAGLIFAILPRVTWMGIEGRSPALATMLVTISTVLLIRATRSSSVGWWIGYTAVATAGCYVFAYTWLIVLAQGITVAAWSRRTRPVRFAHPLVRWGISAAVTTVAILPLLSVIMGQRSQVGWIQPFAPPDVGRVLLNQWFMDGPIAVVGWILVVVGVVAWARETQRWNSLPLMLATIAFPTLALVVTSIAILPLWIPRYLAFCAPFVALAISEGVDALRRRWLQAVALVVFVALCLIPYLEQRSTVAGDGTDTLAIVREITQARDPEVSTGVAFATLDDGTTSRSMLVAYPDTFTGMKDVTFDRSAAEIGLLFDSDIPLSEADLDGLDELFVMQSGVPQLAGWRVVDSWPSERFTLSFLERE